MCLRIASLLAIFFRADALIAKWDDRGSLATAGENTTRGLALSVPGNLSRFEGLFESLRLKDEVLPRSRKRKMLKVMLGVFSVIGPRAKEIRQILRKTWMNHPDVCMIDNITSDCAIRVAFVTGAKGADDQDELTQDEYGTDILVDEPDVLSLDFEENMNEGKTFHWLQFASRRFEWADYVGKLDDDVFLHVTPVLNSLPVFLNFGANYNGSYQTEKFFNDQHIINGNCEAYVGKPWACKPKDSALCPPTFCGPPIDRNFTLYAAAPEAGCWSYMQGGFYALTRALARNITEPGGYFDEHKVGYEDLMTGRAVHEYVRQSGTCVRTWAKEDVIDNRLYLHKGGGLHPGYMGFDWNWFYGFV